MAATEQQRQSNTLNDIRLQQQLHPKFLERLSIHNFTYVTSAKLAANSAAYIVNAAGAADAALSASSHYDAARPAGAIEEGV